MKTTIYSLLAAAACGMAFGQTAYTTPVGYETLSLPAGVEYNLIGLRLQQPTIAAGALTAVAANKVSDSNVNFTTLLTAGRTYILEINDGSFAGLIQEVVSWGTASGNTVNDLVTPSNLAAFPVAVGAKYKLRVAPTLEEIFAGSTTVLNGFTAGQADNVWVPNGVGGFTKYFRSSLVGNPWKNAATSVNSPNVPLVYQDGLLVQKRATSPTSSIVVSGEVKGKGTISPLLVGTASAPSYNLLGSVYPAGSTLQNIGIKASLLPGFTAGQADNVWLSNGAGGYVKYFVSSLAGNPWKLSATSVNVAVDVPITSGIIVERKSAAVNLNLTPPTTYSEF